MKKFLLLVILSIFLIAGCGKKEETIVKDFESTIKGIKSYNLVGDMVIASNEDKYSYNVDVTYLDGGYYKVSLVNKENNHEQIILKNSDGVYVITPSLNKSFKFQSEWPTNSSQSYILETLLNDVMNDSERGIEKNKDEYVITSKVNYPNNKELVSQDITLDSNYLPKSIVVKNSSGIEQITMNITKIDTKTKYDKEYFLLSNCIKEGEVTTTTGSLEDIVYPMYLPSGTTYSGEEVITNEDSERVILTYTGVKPFILIEEASVASENHETTAVSGEVVQYGNILGVLTETSLNWANNGKEYYIIGDDLSKEELLQIASSTATVAISK